MTVSVDKTGATEATLPLFTANVILSAPSAVPDKTKYSATIDGVTKSAVVPEKIVFLYVPFSDDTEITYTYGDCQPATITEAITVPTTYEFTLPIPAGCYGVPPNSQGNIAIYVVGAILLIGSVGVLTEVYKHTRERK